MSEKIFKKLLDYLSNSDLKRFEDEINKLFKVKENQSNPTLLNLYGLFIEAKNDTNKAINIFANCIKINPEYASPYFNLGRIYAQNNMFKFAIKFLEKHIERDESIYDSYDILAKCYYHDYQYENSIKVINKIFDYFKQDLTPAQKAYLYNMLGANYNLNHNIDLSLESYKKALSFDENDVKAIGNIGNVLRSKGQVDEAKEYFKKALKLDPKNADIHKDLSVITKYDSDSHEHLTEMKALIEVEKSEKKKSNLAFALAKACEDIKDYSKTSKYLKMANDLRRKEFNYTINKDYDEMKFHKNFFKVSHLPAPSKKGDIVPVFILGMPRSGTTLVEQILSSHSKVEAGDEISYFADSIVKAIPHSNLDEFRKKFLDDRENIINEIRQNYLNKLKKISNNKQFITDKMPINFKLIGFIKEALPEAKIIHCIREGRDTCLSIYKNNFATHAMPWAYDEKELSQFFNIYVSYMKFWKEYYDSFIYDLSYSDLLQNTEKNIKNLLKFCNLDFEKNCLEFYKNKRAVNTVSTLQVRQPIYKSSLNLWKNFEEHLPTLFKEIDNYKLN